MSKVLVVEDDPDGLVVVTRTLEKAGHLVVPAANGWEGLLALDAHNVDAIVLDLMMPGMNGSAFLRILRNDQRRKYLPVIVLSALASGDLLKSTIELGVQAWFTKAQYTSQDLLDAVERLTVPVPLSDESARYAESRNISRWENVRWRDN